MIAHQEPPPPKLGQDNAQAQTNIHASAVVIKEAGILIRGSSGAGKSSLALALIEAGERAGYFTRLVGDDRIKLEIHGGRLIARGHPQIMGQIERRGQGILQIPFLCAAVVQLVIDLVPTNRAPPRYPDPGSEYTLLAGIKLPLMTLRQNTAISDLAFDVLRRFRFGDQALLTSLTSQK
jgi:HPr kinase/phosphorylase